MMFLFHVKRVKRIVFILVIGVACSLQGFPRRLGVALWQDDATLTADSGVETAAADNSSNSLVSSRFFTVNNATVENDNNTNTTTAATTSTTTPTDFAWWRDADCLTPLPEPVMGTHDLSRIINVGMPKMGSSSIQAYFLPLYGPGKARHFHCGKAGYCGTCIQKAVKQGRPPLTSCGNFTVYSQMDRLTDSKSVCNFPQVLYLPEIYRENPHATLILPMRNISAWYNSLAHWTAHGRITSMQKRFQKCKLPTLNFTAQMGQDPADYAVLVCNHVRQIRQFVHLHPTLTLIEFQLEHNDTGALLERYFPGTWAQHWTRKNVQGKLHRNETAAAS